MSIRVTTKVWEHVPYREGTLLVLLALADWASDDGSRIFPTIERLAEKARLSERATQGILRRLEKDKVIECVKRAGGRPGRASEYRIVLERVAELQPSMALDSIGQRVQELHPSTGEVGDTTDEAEYTDGCSAKQSTGELDDCPIDNRQDNPLFNRHAADGLRSESGSPCAADVIPWEQFQSALTKQFDAAVWDAWFDGAELRRGTDGFIVVVDKPFKRNWIANNFITKLERALRESVSICVKAGK